MRNTNGPMAKKYVLRVIVGLSFVDDAHILNEDRVLSEMVPASDWRGVREVAALVDALRRNFDYLASPEFENKVSGKSPSVRAMMQRMDSEPVRVRDRNERVEKALSALLENDEAFHLFPKSKHGDLGRIVQLVRGMSLPD